MKCHLDFACLVIPKAKSMSYHRYYKNQHAELANTSFVMSPASTTEDLYDQYICDLGSVLDRHALLICQS